jgi:Holliday junction resolvasome RuvABC endonuclease subunit
VSAEIARLEARLTGSRRKSAQEAWEPPQRSDFAQDVVVFAFDGSLGNAGWVSLWCTDAVIMVRRKGTIRPQTDLDGYRGTWERAIQLNTALLGLLDEEFMLADLIAVEAPMVAGGHRTESSLIAALQVWQWADPGKRLDVGATHVSRVLLGSARVSKDDRKNAIKAAVARLIPGSDERTWNEHERDAAAIALTVLYDLAHR